MPFRHKLGTCKGQLLDSMERDFCIMQTTPLIGCFCCAWARQVCDAYMVGLQGNGGRGGIVVVSGGDAL
jgi:hypothetical protein